MDNNFEELCVCESKQDVLYDILFCPAYNNSALELSKKDRREIEKIINLFTNSLPTREFLE